MKKIFLLICLCLLAVVTQAQTPGSWQQLDQRLRKEQFSGAIRVTKGAEVLFEQAYGFADAATQKPNTSDTVFHIGSLTKPITAAAILQLVAQERLKLHAPLAQHLEGWPREITVHHLLAHSSGLNDLSKRDYEQLLTRETSSAEWLALLKPTKLRFAPGARFEYANANYLVLGALLEKLTAQSYGAYLQRNVFAPAGMKATGYDALSRRNSALAQGYLANGRVAPFANMSAALSAGGLHATVGDLDRFTRALWQGRLLASAFAQQMWQPHAGKYGYGWSILERFQRTVYWHNGSVPGFFGFIAYAPRDDVFIGLLSNSDRNQGATVRRIAEIVFRSN
jgi:CubicO group peptidase (beta-lactamase class C family)